LSAPRPEEDQNAQLLTTNCFQVSENSFTYFAFSTKWNLALLMPSFSWRHFSAVSPRCSAERRVLGRLLFWHCAGV